jgi:GST-like protein
MRVMARDIVGKANTGPPCPSPRELTLNARAAAKSGKIQTAHCLPQRLRHLSSTVAKAKGRDHGMAQPIELHYWPTPNGHKITIALEEMGLPYQLHPVDIGKGEQFRPEFLAISPNNRMPAIVDPEGPDGQAISVFESGAILQYLARKTDSFYGRDERERVEVEQWLFWQVAGLGPMAGQAHHFRGYGPTFLKDQRQLAYGANRYTNEAHRLYGVLNKRLADRAYVAGDYTIADIAAWPWASLWGLQGVVLEDFPNLKAWLERIGEREAVKRAMQQAEAVRAPNLAAVGPEAEARRRILFNQRAR